MYSFPDLEPVCCSMFILSALWWIRIRGLWKLPDGRDWLRGKLGLVMMSGAMLSSVQSVSRVSLWPHGLQHARLPCLSPAPGAYSNSCPSSRWCHSAISSSVFPFSSCLQSFPASRSFPMSQFFAPNGQYIGTSASASGLPMNSQDWFPLGLIGWISL